jgi:adenylyl cyclase-associated protein
MDEQLKRLETVTNRLESIVSQLASSNQTSESNSNDDSVDRLNHLPIIRDYQTIINESLKPFLVVSSKIGNDLNSMIDHVQRVFDAQQTFILQAVQSKKPTEQQIIEAIKAQSTEIEAIAGINE